MFKRSHVALLLLSGVFAVAACTGDKGAAGSNGADGSDGKNGANGADGEPGADGTKGSDGEMGTMGDPGAMGEPGAMGDPGAMGEPGSDGAPGIDATSLLSFAPVAFPADDAAKRLVSGTTSAKIDGVDHAIGFHTLLRTGDQPVAAGPVYGRLVDHTGAVIKTESGADDVQSYLDFSSLLQVGEKLFQVTHVESLPGAHYLSELAQAADGTLSVVSTKPIDLSSIDGIWDPCAGNVTPWGSHLGGEEYPADARAFEGYTKVEDMDKDFHRPMLRYFGLDIYSTDAGGALTLTMPQVKAVYSPYMYGFAVEEKVDASGNATPAKHYAMGRAAIELPYVMPDYKTVYISDDGQNDAFYMFVADVAGDLDAGTLYAAKWEQTSAAAAGYAKIHWISLGHATSAQVSKLIHVDKVAFSDIFMTEAPVGSGCPNFTPVNTDTGFECLKLQPGMELAASRLETRRYAAYLGATTEFRKTEGITFDPATSKLFVSISNLERGMEDAKKAGVANDTYDKGGPNDIRLGYNKCGAVYQLPIGYDPVIGSNYVVKKWETLVAGTPSTAVADNACDIDGIASPDNLTFIPGYNTLIIGEDTDYHQNDAVWAFNLATKKLSRIQTTPYGSESTSVYWYPNINGFAYLKSVVQHPYGESDQTQNNNDLTLNRAYDGYIGPFPAMD